MSAPQSQHAFKHSLSHWEKERVLFVLGLVLFTHIVDFMVLMPLGPQLIRLFNIAPSQFSWLVSVYSFSAGICGFLGSLIFDRVDRKKALIAAYAGFLVGTLFCALSPTYEVLLISRAVSGAFGGVLNAICFAIVADVFFIQERGTATGKLMTSFSLAAVFGVPFGLLLSNSFEWHAPFVGIVVLGIPILAGIVRYVPSVAPKPHIQFENFFSGISQNLKDRNATLALILTFAMMMSQFVVIPLISPYLVLNTGFPEKHLWLVYLLGGLFTAFTGPVMGKLCDRYGARTVFVRTGLLFLIPIFLITRLGHVGMSISLVVTTLFFVFSNSRMVPAMTIITASVPPERRGSYMSLNSSLQQLGSATASFAGGLTVTMSQSFDGTPSELLGFSNTAYLAAIFGILAYWVGRKVRMVA